MTVQIKNLSKSYTAKRTILNHVDLTIQEGEFFVLLGRSGGGKSTLLNLISGIDKPDNPHDAQIIIGQTNISKLNDTQLTLFRRDNVGIIFQFFNLIPTLTVLENITLPMELRGDKSQLSNKIGQTMLERVGLGERDHAFPDQLSGGEQQRIAIARALAHEPKLILADEPTGNLDEETGEHVLKLLLELTRDAGKTLIMATHNPEIIPLADRVCRIQEGQLVFSN